MYRRTFAEINLDHLVHNFQAIRTALPKAPFLCPMVKANAYGHGDVAVSLCLQHAGAKHLGVCLVEEGVQLRQAGITVDVLVFRGFDRQGAEEILNSRLTPVISTWEQFDILENVLKSKGDKAWQVHLKFNTGMNRLGFQPEEAQKLFDRCWQNKWIRVQGILTHLYNGEEASDPNSSSCEQLKRLQDAAEIFKPLNPILHSLNSSAIINAIALQGKVTDHPLFQEEWGLRPGLMLYGYNPTVHKDTLVLKPVMTFRSEAGNYRDVQAGETVSYGGTWKAPQKSVIAVVPTGYADGYHRILSNKSHVLFRNQRAAVVGNICMDFFMINVTDLVKGEKVTDLPHEDVVLFGQDAKGNFLSADELAQKAQTISWEILTSVGPRVPRVYVGEWARKLGVAS